MSHPNHDIVEAPDGWRVALAAFDEEGFTFGSEITHAWLLEALGLKEPASGAGYEAFQKFSIQKMNAVCLFARELLQARNMALQNIRGRGYRVVLPPEQTSWAKEEWQDDMRRVCAKAGERLSNIDFSQLSAVQQKENADVRAHVGTVR
ncbi:MAG: hypothetical protein ACR2RE_23695, partial [Geminicoccaceae bacterium]